MSLALDARQRAMLAEMGVRLWLPTAHAGARAPVAPAGEPERSATNRVADRARIHTVDGRNDPGLIQQTTPATVAMVRAPAAAPAPVHDSAAPLGERPAGVDSMDWPQLEATVAACRAYGLCAGRTRTVFGVGQQTADWMVVGEAPGENEDRQGEPFVGQAGKLLDAMLRALGLDRRSDVPEAGVYIANVLKCRPPGNRNPQPDEVAQCEPYLRRQVALVQPKIILAMGRFAVQSLLNTTEPIGRLRGRVHQYQGVPVVVTYHPAYLLRALPEKAKAWDDLCRARAVLQGAAVG